jgi:hypothetical protein
MASHNPIAEIQNSQSIAQSSSVKRASTATNAAPTTATQVSKHHPQNRKHRAAIRRNGVASTIAAHASPTIEQAAKAAHVLNGSVELSIALPPVIRTAQGKGSPSELPLPVCGVTSGNEPPSHLKNHSICHFASRQR